MPADHLRVLSSPFILGGAQLGMPYGIARRAPEPTRDSVFAILQAAQEAGVHAVDLAPHYGHSEAWVGEFALRTRWKELMVFTKVAPTIDPDDIHAVRESVLRSKDHFPRNPLALAICNVSWLDGELGSVLELLAQLQKEGVIVSSGVSVYTPAQLEKAAQYDALSFFQVPGNVFDRRIAGADIYARLIRQERTVCLRSIFLQGLLTAPLSQAQSLLPAAAGYLAAWHELCTRIGRDPHDAAVQYVRAVLPRSPLVIGCEDAAQVRRNVHALCATLPAEAITAINAWEIPPVEIIEPFRWRIHETTARS